MQVLAETLHCVPDHVLDAPPRQLAAYQQPIAGLADVELPHSPWTPAVGVSLPATAAQEMRQDARSEDAWLEPGQEAVTSIDVLQTASTRTHVVAVTA